MDNFSKFLTDREDLKLILKSKSSSKGVYFIVLLFLLAFFVLWPMWKTSYQSFLLWCLWVIFLTFLLIREIIGQNNVYLLTNKRIIHLKAISKLEYKFIGFIKISDLEHVYKKKNNIYIVARNRKYYLPAIDLSEEFYKKLNSYIKV